MKFIVKVLHERIEVPKYTRTFDYRMHADEYVSKIMFDLNRQWEKVNTDSKKLIKWRGSTKQWVQTMFEEDEDGHWDEHGFWTDGDTYEIQLFITQA